MAVIEINSASRRFDDAKAVSGSKRKTGEGDIVLAGPSGCGTTPTMRCIAGLENLTEGAILIGGEDMTGPDPLERDGAEDFRNDAARLHLTLFEPMAACLAARGWRTPANDGEAAFSLDLGTASTRSDLLPCNRQRYLE